MRFRFAECVLDIEAHSLTREGVAQKIEPQVFDLLHLLARNAGQLVSWNRIIEEVWQGRIVSDSTVSARVAALRRAVGDTGTRQSIVRTVPRRGLQFVAEMESEEEATFSASDTSGPGVQFTAADDGLILAFAVSGAGPPLVRTAHFPTHLETERIDIVDRPLFEDLESYATLVRYDVRGTGLSENRIEDLSLDISIEDLRTVADAVGLDRFDLMGSSGSGAMTAIGFAARYPERVRRLVLQSGCAEGRSARSKADDMSTDTIEGMIREGWGKPGSPFLAAYLTTYFPAAPAGWVADLSAKIQGWSLPESAILHRRVFNTLSVVDLLGKVSAPTLVIQSREDAVHTVEEGRRLAAGISNARLHVFDSPNHYITPGEAALPAFLATLRAFLTADEGQLQG